MAILVLLAGLIGMSLWASSALRALRAALLPVAILVSSPAKEQRLRSRIGREYAHQSRAQNAAHWERD